jgi:hypothetical protein
MFSRLFVAVSLLSVCLIVACNSSKEELDERILGQWSDGNTSYHFKANKIFGIKYQRQGLGIDAVTTDSIWGTYQVDKKRSNIYFEAEYLTLKSKPDSVIKRRTNLPVLNYLIQGDSLLNYTSNTIKGSLKKRKTILP